MPLLCQTATGVTSNDLEHIFKVYLFSFINAIMLLSILTSNVGLSWQLSYYIKTHIIYLQITSYHITSEML